MKRFFIGLFFTIMSIVTFGQPIGGGPGDGGDPDEVPLGFIEVLLVAGGLFGAKKWLDRNKNT